ncbi:hypothetical protein [Xanthomonas phage OP1]|uniref:Uncharacterized protein n=1 Tax=Xanthomonas phage OP1 TaxID=2994040 RepID=Q2NPD9_9CAUD|nr:hypothetical protein OP1_ORF52 [Xanthomonas phage OP1]BAE72757.1 hypothetical protein [Xanthomonas phage OP1]
MMTTKFFKVRARVVYETFITVEAADGETALLAANEFFDDMYTTPDNLELEVVGEEEVTQYDEYLNQINNLGY